MSAATSAIRRHISASWKQRTGSRAAPMRSSKPIGAPGRVSCGSGQPLSRRPWTQRVVCRRHPLRARAGRLGLRLLHHQPALAATPPALPGGRVPGPRGYRQRLWPCRANIQHDDRGSGREEEGTRLKPLPSPRGPTPPSARASLTFHRTKQDPSPHTHTHR